MMRVCAYLGAVEGGWGTDAPRMWIPPFSTLAYFHGSTVPPPSDALGFEDIPSWVSIRKPERDAFIERWDIESALGSAF